MWHPPFTMFCAICRSAAVSASSFVLYPTLYVTHRRSIHLGFSRRRVRLFAIAGQVVSLNETGEVVSVTIKPCAGMAYTRPMTFARIAERSTVTAVGGVAGRLCVPLQTRQGLTQVLAHPPVAHQLGRNRCAVGRRKASHHLELREPTRDTRQGRFRGVAIRCVECCPLRRVASSSSSGRTVSELPPQRATSAARA
jgi:hypothetical protein